MSEYEDIYYNFEEEEIKIPLDGREIPFVIRGLSRAEQSELYGKCSTIEGFGQKMSFDSSRFERLLITTGTVKPKLSEEQVKRLRAEIYDALLLRINNKSDLSPEFKKNLPANFQQDF